MRTQRVTVLMRPEEKTGIEAEAAGLGISSGEYIRLAVDNFRRDQPPEEELATLSRELIESLPAMDASLDRSIATLDRIHARVDGFLRQMGARA